MEPLKTRCIIFNQTHVNECCYSIVLYNKQIKFCIPKYHLLGFSDTKNFICFLIK